MSGIHITARNFSSRSPFVGELHVYFYAAQNTLNQHLKFLLEHVCTEISQADYECLQIKEAIKHSALNHFIQESPYRLCIQIRKTFLKDFSPVVNSNASTPISSQRMNRSNCASLFSASPTYEDSGIQTDSVENQDITEELFKTKLEVSDLNSPVNLPKLVRIS